MPVMPKKVAVYYFIYKINTINVKKKKKKAEQLNCQAYSFVFVLSIWQPAGEKNPSQYFEFGLQYLV